MALIISPESQLPLEVVRKIGNFKQVVPLTRFQLQWTHHSKVTTPPLLSLDQLLPTAASLDCSITRLLYFGLEFWCNWTKTSVEFAGLAAASHKTRVLREQWVGEFHLKGRTAGTASQHRVLKKIPSAHLNKPHRQHPFPVQQGPCSSVSVDRTHAHARTHAVSFQLHRPAT